MKQQIVQDQRQILTPLLVQQMELLTLPLPELREKILEEAERNPLIRLEKPLSPLSRHSLKRPPLPTAPEFVLENQADHRNLLNHVLEQIHVAEWSDREEAIAMLLLTSLDSHGFLREDIETLREGTDYTPEEIETVRQRLLHLDPLGLGSRGVLEFLLLQAREEFGEESLEVAILQHTADLLEKKHYAQIARQLRVSVEEVEQAVKNLSELRPGPVTGWGETAITVIPEAFVEVSGENVLIRLNEYYIPDVRLDQFYLSLAEDTKLSREEKKFLRSHLSSAQQLIENLQSRKEIVYKVIHAIVSYQKDFFTRGPQYLKPLKLLDIATAIDVHESTVSRVVKDKYIQVGDRIIPLKQFFSSSIRTANQQEVSSKGIQDMIARIIAQEEKTDPLSDEQIVSILQNKGIQVSRRTVAKYRTLLGIPPAHARREER